MPSSSIPAIPVFVISLARATQRRAGIVARLDAAGVDYEITDAVDGKDLDLSALKNRIKNRDLTRGEFGCFLSHYNLWQRIVDEKIPHAIILEDDAVCNADFFDIVAKLPTVDWHWDLINLCYRTRIRVNFHLCDLGRGYALVRNKRPTNYAIAYIATLDGAKKMLKHCYAMRIGVDLQRRRYWEYGLDFFSVDPPLGFQSGSASVIGEFGRTQRNFIKIHIGDRFARMNFKLRSNLYNLLHKPRRK